MQRSSILVLDEATANVDTHTEVLLKRALQKRFADATIVMIAHRLDTIIDFDSILVLGNGRVLEYGSPQELLAAAASNTTATNDNSHDGQPNDGRGSDGASDGAGTFASMVSHMGEEAAKRLKELAKKK